MRSSSSIRCKTETLPPGGFCKMRCHGGVVYLSCSFFLYLTFLVEVRRFDFTVEPDSFLESLDLGFNMTLVNMDESFQCFIGVGTNDLWIREHNDQWSTPRPGPKSWSARFQSQLSCFRKVPGSSGTIALHFASSTPMAPIGPSLSYTCSLVTVKFQHGMCDTRGRLPLTRTRPVLLRYTLAAYHLILFSRADYRLPSTQASPPCVTEMTQWSTLELSVM